MNKKSVFAFLWVFNTIYSIAISSDCVSTTDNLSKPFELKDSIKKSLIYSFQGLHLINDRGWYLINKHIAESIKGFYDHKNCYKVKTFSQPYDEFDLVLVKFENSQDSSPLDETTFLEALADPKDIDDYRWVLSLAKPPSKYEGNILNILPPSDKLLQAVSYTHRENGMIILTKGTIKDFYSTSHHFFQSKTIALCNQHLNKIGISCQQNQKAAFIKNHINQYISPHIIELKKSLDSLKLCRNVIASEANFFSREKINIGLRPVNSLLEASLESLEKEIKDKKNMRDRFLNFPSSLKEPEVNELWDRHVKSLLEEKNLVLFKKEKLIKKPLSDASINNLWGFEGQVYSGVADINDIGGGIYSFPQTYNLLQNENHPSTYKLIGITISVENQGETSIALDLTNQKIRDWMIKSIRFYYENLHNSKPIQ